MLPNDVIDIAVTALISVLRTSPPTIRGPAGDNVDPNVRAYYKVLPDESTPQSRRAAEPQSRRQNGRLSGIRFVSRISWRRPFGRMDWSVTVRRTAG
jgi:hypothetical protein